ncbi:Uncharacterised protein [Streptococcus pneumoniae]|nr:Uncharacterised protein [Streptococcus pneumoniae]
MNLKTSMTRGRQAGYQFITIGEVSIALHRLHKLRH